MQRKHSISKSRVRAANQRTTHRSIVPADQADTPQRRRHILLAATKLFSEHGYNGVSVRDIAAQANVTVALCGYYFGRKSELFMALFSHDAGDVKDRVNAIRKLRGHKGQSEFLEQLVRAWAEPVLSKRAKAESASFSILVARSLWDTAKEAQAAIEAFYDPVARAFLQALKKAMPGHDHADLIWGYEWALGALLMHLADKRIERISGGRVKSGDPEKIETFVRFVCAGLRSIAKKTV